MHGAVGTASTAVHAGAVVPVADTHVTAWHHAHRPSISAPNTRTRTHTQTRLLALQLADRLFVASRPFRRRVCANFQTFLELTVGHSASRPLPPPVETGACCTNLSESGSPLYAPSRGV
jgi:hypothetical protein